MRYSTNKKKLTDVLSVEVETAEENIDGVLISDKVGEGKFINFEKLVLGQQLPENEKEELAKIIFGQQQEVTALLHSSDKKVLAAVDTLHRLRISEFPNVFHIKQVFLEHKK